MGESGGSSLTGPRLHQMGDSEAKMTAGGAWRRPRMKVYDYNQEFGGNYYQPMIQYINHKDIYGPFSKKADVYLPHSAEVTSAKYTNMRYNDKSSAKHNLDQFLIDAHKTQIKELNGTTAMARVNLMKNIVTSRRQPHQTAEGGSSRPGGGHPLHQRALHRQGRQPQAFWARCRGQRLPVPQPPIGEGLCQPDPPCLTSTLLIYHMVSVVVVMTIILMMIFMKTTPSLIYCLTVSSVFWPDVCYIEISAASNTFVLAPICSKSYSIE